MAVLLVQSLAAWLEIITPLHKVEQRQFAKPKHVIMKLVKKFTVIVQSSLELMDISTDLDLANRKIKI